MKNGTRQIIEVAPEFLMEHSVLENIPRLTSDQLSALAESIASKGLMDPLAVVPNPQHEGTYLILDGRHRFEVLRKAGNPIPCVVHAEKDPLDFAIEKSVQGRQLTKSGIVLILFLNHPDLNNPAARKARSKAGGNPVNKFTGSVEKGREKGQSSFASLAEKYRVPREYFSALAEIREQCDEEKWSFVKMAILEGETCIPRIPSMLAGSQHTKGKKRIDPVYGRLAPRAATTIANTFINWGKIKWLSTIHREATLQKFATAFAVMPDEVRTLNADAIVKSWPAHDQKRLFVELKSKLHK